MTLHYVIVLTSFWNSTRTKFGCISFLPSHFHLYQLQTTFLNILRGRMGGGLSIRQILKNNCFYTSEEFIYVFKDGTLYLIPSSSFAQFLSHPHTQEASILLHLQNGFSSPWTFIYLSVGLSVGWLSSRSVHLFVIIFTCILQVQQTMRFTAPVPSGISFRLKM